jgi:hypothetical protein
MRTNLTSGLGRSAAALAVAAVALFAAGTSAQAREFHHWNHGWNHGWNHWHGAYANPYWGPRYYAPPAYYGAPAYYPPPAYYGPPGLNFTIPFG